MPRRGHTKEQIITAPWQAESSVPVEEVRRQVEISETTFYTWKRRYAGIGMVLYGVTASMASGLCSCSLESIRRGRVQPPSLRALLSFLGDGQEDQPHCASGRGT